MYRVCAGSFYKLQIRRFEANVGDTLYTNVPNKKRSLHCAAFFIMFLHLSMILRHTLRGRNFRGEKVSRKKKKREILGIYFREWPTESFSREKKLSRIEGTLRFCWFSHLKLSFSTKLWAFFFVKRKNAKVSPRKVIIAIREGRLHFTTQILRFWAKTAIVCPLRYDS